MKLQFLKIFFDKNHFNQHYGNAKLKKNVGNP